MGSVCLLCIPFLAAVPLLPPHYRFVLRWGDSVDLGFPHPSSLEGLAQGVRVVDREVTLLPPLGQGVPPLPLLQAMHEERTLLLSSAPPFFFPLDVI